MQPWCSPNSKYGSRFHEHEGVDTSSWICLISPAHPSARRAVGQTLLGLLVGLLLFRRRRVPDDDTQSPRSVVLVFPRSYLTRLCFVC